MRAIMKKEDGLAVVEATWLLPFCTIMIVALFYAAIFMCQKANLQANVQTALTYYKTIYSDNYVEVSGDADNRKLGNSYGTPTYKFPYRFLNMSYSDEDKMNFEKYFKAICGYMFFDDGTNVNVESSVHNYIVYKTIEVTATQTVKPAISLKMVGGSDSINIVVTGTAVISNGDEFERNVDFVIDIFNQSSLGQKAQELVDKCVKFYGDFKEKFNIGESVTQNKSGS